MASRVELTNLTRGTLHLGRSHKIAPHKTITLFTMRVMIDEETAYLIYRFAKEKKLFGRIDGIVSPPEDLILELTDPFSTSRGTEFPVNAPIGKLFFRTNSGINGELYLRDNSGWTNISSGAGGIHGHTHLPSSFGGTDPIPGLERIQDLYNCTAFESVLDLVYQAGGDTVERADASNIATMPALGFIESKPTPTSCIVTTRGILSGFIAKYAALGDLITDVPYFADPFNPGLITSVPPSIGGQVSQLIGYSKNSNELLVDIDSVILL